MGGPAPQLAGPTTRTTAAPLTLSVLGPLHLARDGVPIELPGPKLRLLLCYLAVHAGEPVSRDRLVEALWGDRDPAKALATLRVHVSRLRDAIEVDRQAPARVLVTQGPAYRLDPTAIDLDLHRVEELAAEGRARRQDDPRRAAALLGEALSLWRGRPLQDVEYEDFAQPTIRRLERVRLEVVLDRVEALAALGEDDATVAELDPLVHDDPVAERPTELLVRALYRVGRPHDALRCLRRHQRTLARDGLDPSPRIATLERQVLRHDPSLTVHATSHGAGPGVSGAVRGYELRGTVGRGPIGTVHRAYQRSVGREVALKVVHRHLAVDPAVIRHFAEQVQRLAACQHSHLVPILDAWREPGAAYLVTPWFDGGSLAEPVVAPVVDGLGERFAALADALATLHEAGLVHGAVTASNVLLDAHGRAYLADVRLPVLDAGADVDRTPQADVRGLASLLVAILGRPEVQAGDPGLRRDLADLAGTVLTPATDAQVPDAAAWRADLLQLAGTAPPAPRRSRRNPYKGLAAFTEADREDLFGRDDTLRVLLDAVDRSGLTAVLGASGSGKSSVVLGGLIPHLRDGALPGSDAWTILTMLPGADPFDAFEVALRQVAVAPPDVPLAMGAPGFDLRDVLASALPSPTSPVLLVIDQFEEVFAPQVGRETTERFLHELVALATHEDRQVRVVVTLRADLVEPALAHPGLGELLARTSLVLAPLSLDQLAEAIRRPAARVGVQVDPELVAELSRDVAGAPAQLPLLQYVLTELFERRSSDRLTLADYRHLGRLDGVLERRAEATYGDLPAGTQAVARHLLLRLVQLPDHGAPTRRRVPTTELQGLAARGDVDAALTAFTRVRLLAHDRDPISRTPTVEVAHEAVLVAWPRLRGWVEDARAALLVHRRVAAAEVAWREAGEDPAYLLQGGPLAAAVGLREDRRVALNAAEARFVEASADAAAVAAERVADEQQAHRELQQRARRRLRIGSAAAAVAILVAAVAAFAWVQRDRAQDLAALRADENLARRLAAASGTQRTSADPDLALLLAIESAHRTLGSGGEILPEAVDALHLALITPRPALVVEGAATDARGPLVAWGGSGRHLVVLGDDASVRVHNPWDGGELARVPPVRPAAFGLAVHRDGQTVDTYHPDGVRSWTWQNGELVDTLPHPVPVTAAVTSHDGALRAVGGVDGRVRIWRDGTATDTPVLHDGPVTSLDLDPTGTRIVTAGGPPDAPTILVWDVATAEVLVEGPTERLLLPVWHVVWHPSADLVAVSSQQGEIFSFDTVTGERLFAYGNGQVLARRIGFDATGNFVGTTGADGVTRLFGTWSGGESVVELRAGGVPVLDAVAHPREESAATVGVDGAVRVWRELKGSELPERWTSALYPRMSGAADVDRYVLTQPGARYGIPETWVPTAEVYDVGSAAPLVSRPNLRDWGVHRPAITPAGDRVAFAADHGDVEIVTVTNGAVVRVPGSAGHTRGLAFSPDGRHLAGTGDDGRVVVWTTADGALATELLGHGPPLDVVELTDIADPRDPAAVAPDVAFLDDVRLVSAGADGTVRLWRLDGRGRTGGRELAQLEHGARTLAAHGPKGLVATADRVGAVVVVEVPDGDDETPTVRELEPVDGRTELTFSPDGTVLAGAGPGQAVHLWDIATGRVARRLHGPIYPPSSAVFADDGRELHVASGEGIVRGYLLDPPALLAYAEERVTRELTDEECHRYLGEACDVRA